MMDSVLQLFDTSGFVPRWVCGRWTPLHGWLHVVSDWLVFGAYTAIPCILAYFVRRRKDTPFPAIYWLFCAFIFACGTTHLVDSVLFWWPAYRVSALAKVATALVSWTTVLALIPTLPKALRLPRLAIINDRLQSEIAERCRAERESRASELRIRSIVDHVVDGIITIDERGMIQSFNRAAEKLFGYSAADVVGRDVGMLMPEPHQAADEQYLQNYLRTGVARIIGIGREVLGRRQDGSEFPAELAISEFRLGSQRYFTGIVRDVTERKRSLELIEERRREMEEFLSIAAHDLRRPLVSVQGLLSIIREEAASALSGQHADLLRSALGEADRMQQLLKDLERLARIERAEAATQPARLREVIDKCLEPFASRIEAGGVRVDVDCPDVEGQFGVLQVEEALINLVENALLYGAAARGSRLRLRGSVSGQTAAITVADDGPGIARADHDRVFQLFKRLGPASVKGSGIGLCAVRRLMKRLGGDVSLDSDIGRGAEFTIRFPIGSIPSPAAATARTAAPPACTAQSRTVAQHADSAALDILLVEDDALHAEVIRRAAARARRRNKLHHVSDGDIALDYLCNQGEFADRDRFPRPGLILLDIRLPRADGFEVLSRLKSNHATQDIPVIMVSSSDRADDIERAFSSGAADFLTKPIGFEELSRSIDAVA